VSPFDRIRRQRVLTFCGRLEMRVPIGYPRPMRKEYSLFLEVGDEVVHERYLRWGKGVVVEERRSELPGGFCYVRISFQDGSVRVFDNNFRSDNCCYYAGIRKLENKRRL
jgi:hypothetical protein